MSVARSVIVFSTSLLAVPIAYVINKAGTLHGDFGLLVSGFVSLLIICFLTYLAVMQTNEPTDPMFYVFALGMFSSAIDIMIGLENDGYISGFMSNYLEVGEPYLKTVFGTLCCYWDGTGHYVMYIIMLTYMAFHWKFELIGLYWVGSFGNSILVLIPGNLIGDHRIHWSFILNVPYILIPFLSAVRFLRDRRSLQIEASAVMSSTQKEVQVWKRPLDLFFILCLSFSTCLALFRGFAVLAPDKVIFANYLKHYEPYLLNPDAYPKMQMLVYLFYFIPFYVLSMSALLFPKSVNDSWLVNWSFIHAGAAAQAQFTHIGSSLHRRTSQAFRVPEATDVQILFWFFNLTLLVIPQLFAWHAVRRRKSNLKEKHN